MNADVEKAVGMWVLVTQSGQVVPWVGARATRKQVMAEGAKCISGDDYRRLGTDSARWKLARKLCGYRIVKATITAHLGSTHE